jgi:hypothetical protein
MSSRLADDLTGLAIEVGGLAGLEAIDDAEASLGFGTLAVTGVEVLPLAPTVLHAPPEACVKVR